MTNNICESILVDKTLPLITTILPTYRRPQKLRRAIMSVLNQTYRNLQVCVYDNASGDETASVVAELANLDNRVKYFCHKENVGPLKNYVFGLNRVETPFFSLFADDDFLLPNFYEDAIRDFEKYPEAMFTCLSTAIADNKGRVYWESTATFDEGLYLPPNGLLEIIKKPQISLAWTSILYKKEVLESGVFIDERIKLISDVDWGLKCCAKFPFVINAKRGAMFCVNSNFISYANLVDDVWPDWEIIVDNVMTNDDVPLNIRWKISEWLMKILEGNLKIIINNAIWLRNYEQAYKAIDLMKNYCKQPAEAARLFRKARLFQRSILFNLLYLIYAKARHFYLFNIKSIYTTSHLEKIDLP